MTDAPARERTELANIVGMESSGWEAEDGSEGSMFAKRKIAVKVACY